MKNIKDFWIAGTHSVISALNNENRIVNEVVFLKDGKIDISKELLKKNKKTVFKQVEKNFFKKIFKDTDLAHQNIAAKINKLNKLEIKNHIPNIKNIIILDNITDPRNIGSIIRTAVAFDVDAMIIKDRNFPSKSATMYKSSSGAIENIKIFEVVNLSTTLKFLKENNFWIYSFDGKSNQKLSKEVLNNEKKIFIFGSEQKGISKNLINNSDFVIKININNNRIESLNVSNAVSAALSIINFLDT
ncbi:MAG: 23S rRNA (guanosine(2251)-2'-O)-methyltransferase RlmB [Pelagibacteraceae bacterium]|nr:23S rRNA (guanosine(2251)-2'-O)-methyltransferase RlmB [Pelagibacteraceae bacterium]MCI5079330.1 23S rRNA (guanosine(2251)-2'-O)-methyltransferase RlmB [Pelagibacteraceae bacterium]